MVGVTASIAVAIGAQLTAAGDLGSPKFKINDILERFEIAPGTSSVGQANLLFADTRTLAASGDEDLDLAGSLANAFGATITAAEIVAIFVKAHADNTNNVEISVPASNGFVGPFLAASDGCVVKPGEYALFVSRTGWAVTAGTGDLLNIANSGAGTGVDYDIVLIGRTTAA